MERSRVCVDCGGSGARTYERGRPVERCTTCRGVGLVLADPAHAGRELRELLTSPGADDPAVLALGAGGATRALARAVELLEERVAALEAERRG